MTVMEAKAEVIARILAKDANKWAKEQADDASKMLQEMLAKGELTPQDFAQAVGELTGNHSAMRQLLEKHGMLAATSAMPAFLVKAQERLGEINRQLDAKLKEMHEKPKTDAKKG